MKLYLAGTYTNKIGYRAGNIFARLPPEEQASRDLFGPLLESYHYTSRPAEVDRIRNDKERVFLDSGAFSAYTMGVTIDLPEYCDYIKRNRDIIEEVDGVVMASVLDGIGDPLKTWQNQLAMEALGAKPLPCFHYGEDERYLEWYIARYPYITIGGLVPITSTERLHWLDHIWEKYLIDGSGNAKLRVHGFGMTSPALMRRYPWFSVDSSSWVQIASRGNIFLPEYGIIPISSLSPKAKQAGQHYTTIPRIMQGAVQRRVESLGFKVERLAEVYESRWIFNCRTYADLGRTIPDSPYVHTQLRIFA